MVLIEVKDDDVSLRYFSVEKSKKNHGNKINSVIGAALVVEKHDRRQPAVDHKTSVEEIILFSPDDEFIATRTRSDRTRKTNYIRFTPCRRSRKGIRIDRVIGLKIDLTARVRVLRHSDLVRLPGKKRTVVTGLTRARCNTALYSRFIATFVRNDRSFRCTY